MGRGKSWSREESEAVAKAYVKACITFPSARDHPAKQTMQELDRQFRLLSPDQESGPASLEGRWRARSVSAVKVQFEAIAEDIAKFNAILLSVIELAKTQSLNASDPRVTRAAIAIHLGVARSNQDLNFDAINVDETDWKLYEAWSILKNCSRFSLEVNSPKLATSKENATSIIPRGDVDEFRDKRRERSDSCSKHDTEIRSAPCPDVSPVSRDIPARKKSRLPPLSTVPSLPAKGTRTHVAAPALTSPSARTAKRKQENKDQLQTGERDTGRTKKVRKSTSSPDDGKTFMDQIAQSLKSLAETLSEYNGIRVFSLPEMEGTSSRTTYFNLLAEKFVLKAKMERDKFVKKPSFCSYPTEPTEGLQKPKLRNPEMSLEVQTLKKVVPGGKVRNGFADKENQSRLASNSELPESQREGSKLDILTILTSENVASTKRTDRGDLVEKVDNLEDPWDEPAALRAEDLDLGSQEVQTLENKFSEVHTLRESES